jgi:hypothetical protein
MWIMGLVLSGLGTILSGVNFVTTIICMRAPGMTMFRMPIFTWNILLTSMMVLIAFPVLAAALRHNFTSIPRIRSERPAFDLHYPHIKSGRPRMAVSPGPAAPRSE